MLPCPMLCISVPQRFINSLVLWGDGETFRRWRSSERFWVSLECSVKEDFVKEVKLFFFVIFHYICIKYDILFYGEFFLIQVYIVWHFALFSFGSQPRNEWVSFAMKLCHDILCYHKLNATEPSWSWMKTLKLWGKINLSFLHADCLKYLL